MSANYDRAATFLREMSDIIAMLIAEKFEIPDEQAQTIGVSCVKDACKRFAGEMIYIPKGTLLWIDERDREMLAFYVAHDRDIVATARQFDLSVPQAYRRIRMLQEADFNARQGGLFGDDE